MYCLQTVVTHLCSSECWTNTHHEVATAVELKQRELDAKEKQINVERDALALSLQQLQDQRKQLQKSSVIKEDPGKSSQGGWLASVEDSRFQGITITMPSFLIPWLYKADFDPSSGAVECSCMFAFSHNGLTKRCLSRISEKAAFSTERCSVCFEDAPKPYGLSCNSGHFVCDGCLETLVASNLQEGLGRNQRDEGHIWCPLHGHGCKSRPFNKQRLALHLSDELWGSFCQAQEEGFKEQGRQEERRLMEKRREFELQQEQSLRAQIDKNLNKVLPQKLKREHTISKESQVQQHVQHIKDSILTHRCPKCSQAFTDFNGCLALTCPRCGISYCALCFTDCGSDAHEHIRDACPWRRLADGYFMSVESWQRFHHQRREEKVGNYLAGVAQDVLPEVREAAQVLLR